MKALTLKLKWPPRGLSPNARLNVFSKNNLFQRAKIDCSRSSTCVLRTDSPPSSRQTSSPLTSMPQALSVSPRASIRFFTPSNALGRTSASALPSKTSSPRRCSDESCHRNIQTLHPRLLTVDQPDDLHHEGAT